LFVLEVFWIMENSFERSEVWKESRNLVNLIQKSMPKQLIILIITFCISLTSLAQHTIKGRVIDENGESLSYATVTLLNPVDSTLKFFGVSNLKGIYQIKNIKAGEYIMQFSFVGKEIIYKKITIPSPQGDNMGDIKMKTSILDEVEVIAEYVPIQFKSDTVEFNAKAFQTKPDAVVEDLLKKIPGVEVDEAGNVKALGEDVKKVLVDGKEFFGDDPKVATKNLPAEAVDKVQVFDKKTEEAVFMDIDDGIRDRTINLLLNKDHKKGYFGNFEAGGGKEKEYHYKASGKLYRFSSKLQSAILGMYNNVNEFGYSGKDNQHWGQQINGLNTTGAGGLNLSYNATKYNRYFASYLGRSTKTKLEQETLTENFTEKGSFLQDGLLDSDENDAAHRINFGVRHNFNKKHNLTVDGNINMGSTTTISQLLKYTSLNDSSINNLNNETDFNSFSGFADAKAVYIVKLNNKKTQLKTNISGMYEKNTSDYSWKNITTIFNPDTIYLSDQFQDNNTEKINLSANPTLVQQIKKFWYLSANVNIGLKNDILDRSQGTPQENTIIDSLSADFITNATHIRPALSLRRSSAKRQFNFTLGVGWDQLDKNMEDVINSTKTYFHFLPGFNYSSNYRKGRWLRIRYYSSANMPTINQLLPVTNTINPLSLYEGNIDLTPEYRHNLSAFWSIFDQFSFTSLFIRISGGYTQNKIGLSQTINEDYTQIITPENVPYHYDVLSIVYFSTPIRPLGIKINLRSHEMWNKGISIINAQDNINTNITHSFKLSIENRRKEKWNLNIGGSVSLTNSKYSIAESLNNVYYNTSYFSEIEFTPSDKWSFETKANMVNYNSESFDESISIPLLSAGISYYFLEGKRGSFSLQGLDLLNKSENIKQISEVNYLMQQKSNTLGRLVMLVLRMKIGK